MGRIGLRFIATCAVIVLGVMLDYDVLKSVAVGVLLLPIMSIVERYVQRVAAHAAKYIPAPIFAWAVSILISESPSAFVPVHKPLLGFLCFMIVTVYIIYAFEQIAASVTKSTPPGRPISRITGAMAVVIVTYAFLYTALYRLDPSEFHTLPEGASWIVTFLHFLYFATLTFTTVSFGDIVPQTLLSKYFVLSEVVSAFIFVAYALSGFNHFQEIFKVFSPFAVSQGINTEERENQSG